MQVTIPDYKRPYNLYLYRVDDVISLVDILSENGFASSRKQAKQMIKNGEVWWIHPDCPNWEPAPERGKGWMSVDIRENMRKVYEPNLPLEDLDILFIGGQRDRAMCHRIYFC